MANKRKLPAKKVFITIIPVILIILGTIFLVKKYPQVLGLSQIDSDTEAENSLLIEEVKKLMIIPDEVPTIVTVSEKERVQSQKFFEKAENGDKVLVFTNAKKAILYRPSVNKIVEVGSVNISQETQEETPVATGSASPTLTPSPVQTTPTVIELPR